MFRKILIASIALASISSAALAQNAEPQVIFADVTKKATYAVATANTFQSILSANPYRKGCLIVNNSAIDEKLDVGATPSATYQIDFPAGAQFKCDMGGGVIITSQINVTSATAITSTGTVWEAN